MIIGTIPASSTGTINLTYMPEYIAFVAATVPTQLRVTALGDGVICDLDANGINALNGADEVSRLANAFVIRLADGMIKGRNVEITITNAVASVLTVYGYSERKGIDYLQSIRQTILASSGVEFRDFGLLGLPALGAADTVDILYADGHNQRFMDVELNLLRQQNSWNNTFEVIDNWDGRITSVNVIAATQQTAYLQRFAPVADLSASVLQPQYSD